MADRILQAVAIQRELTEGVDTAMTLHKLIAKYATASLYTKPTLTTNRLKREVMRLLAERFLPLARKTGAKSAAPILAGLGKGVTPAHGVLAKELSRATKANQAKFLVQLERDIDWQNATTRIAFIDARTNGVKRSSLIRDIVKADKSALEGIGDAITMRDMAADELKAAEAKLAKSPKSAEARRAAREARTKLTKTKRAAQTRIPFLPTLESSIRANARNSIRREAYKAQEVAFRAAGYGVQVVYQWIAVNGSAACPDCEGRHGDTRKLSAWSGDGPGAGGTVCGSACMCQLVPEEYSTNNESLASPLTSSL